MDLWSVPRDVCRAAVISIAGRGVARVYIPSGLYVWAVLDDGRHIVVPADQILGALSEDAAKRAGCY